MSDEMSREATSLSHGSGEQTSEINIKPTDNQMTVAELKRKLIDITRASVHQQNLFFRGRVLNNDPTLSEYHVVIDVKEGHNLNLVTHRDGQSAPGSTSGDGNLNTGGNYSSANGQHIRPGQEPHNVIFGANMTETGTGEEMTDQIVRGTYQATPPRSAPPQRPAQQHAQMLVKLCVVILLMGSALLSFEFAATIGRHYPIAFPLVAYLLLLCMTHTLIFLVIFFALVRWDQIQMRS